MTDTYPIDAVIAWVDGDDPAHREKRLRFATKDQTQNDEVGGEIRFSSIGEIYYCVASLLRFAPFIRKIFIVTDGQDPQLGDFIGRFFPETETEVEIIDHKVIYRGYEDCLPVFNSLSIETMLWRIPGLSEHYIYLNDDFMLISPVTREDFFQDGKAICYASKFSLHFGKLLRAVKPKRGGVRIFGFKDAMINAADVAGEKRHFLYIGHIPLAQKRSVFEKFYTEHPEAMEKNMRPRFREPFQYNPQELCYLLGTAGGACTVKPRKGKDLYIKPKDRPGYMERKLRRFDKSKTALFCCFNSLGYASEKDIETATRWIRRRLSIEQTPATF